ncbi:MAG: VTT domain-containing protein [Anaerolineales bacterium]|nr:VTT domain-containing protein [Anaerolineales bacterium]
MSPSKKANPKQPVKAAEKKRKQAKSTKRVSTPKKKTQAPEVIVAESTPVEAKAQKPASSLGTNLLRVLAVLAVIGITVYIYSIRDRVEEFAVYGYPGIFLIALMANATVILPAPGVAVVFAMGSVFNPLGVAFAAGAGGTIGELTGYLAGFSGQAVVENTTMYNRILPWVKKYGAWVILVLSAIPNPFFDIAGVAAGIAKIPIWQFMLACWVGQTIKMAMFAFAGAYSIEWIANFYE